MAVKVNCENAIFRQTQILHGEYLTLVDRAIALPSRSLSAYILLSAVGLIEKEYVLARVESHSSVSDLRLQILPGPS